MGKKTLKFGEIEVKKMPGLNNGLKSYQNLSPQINIIAGPNASGKSSTARAIQQLLWQSATDRITATGQFKIDKESWLSEVDLTFSRFQKGGNNAELKGIPSIEERSRYMLSLQDLIREEESDLAESILKDAIGGYDIDKAYDNLNYSDSKKKTNAKQSSALRDANEKLVQIRDEQKKLQGDQNRLEDLEKEKAEANESKERADFYSLVLNFKEKQKTLQEFEKQLAEFSEKMEQVKEDDHANFEDLLTEIRYNEKAVEGFEIEIGNLREEKDKLNLPENGIDSSEIRKAGNYLEELDDLESEIGVAESEIEKAKTDLEQSSKKLALEIEESEFEGLDADSISTTEQFWQNGFDLFGNSRQLEKQVKKLEGQQKETPKSETLITGISELSKWLSAYGNPAKPLSNLNFVLLFIVALFTAVLVQFFGAPGYFGIAIAAIIIYRIYKNQNAALASADSYIKAEYEKTGLKTPATWEAEDVAQQVSELVDELKEAKQQEFLKNRISDTQDQLKEAKDELEKFEEEVDQLKEKIKVLPNFDAENLKDYSSLYWHLKYVLDWDSARNRINAEESVIEKVNEKKKEWLDKVNPIFEKYGLSSVCKYADAKTAHESLEELRGQFDDLSGKIENAETEQKRALENKGKAEEKLQNICNRLDVSPEDSFQVKELVDDLEDYKILKQKESTAEGLKEDANEHMENHDLYNVEEDEIFNKPVDDVKSLIRKYEQEAEKLNGIRDQITVIETRVNDTKEKHDLEKALQKKDQAILGLEGLYKENAGLIIGDLLVKHLKNDLGEKNMPDVFTRAKILFKRITKNRYELVVDSAGNTAAFRAIDLRDGIGRSLNQLSTGTRIQLIMSVRLAFIEQAEDEIKLPILADELLANSDSQRANAIIDALIEISKEGRQIFYFTAQEDEVAKWEYRLKEEAGTDYKVYVIDQNDEFKPNKLKSFEGIQLHKEISEPGDLSYDKYGQELGVPVLSNFFIPIEKLHIWYLLDDSELLYKIMKQGIENWGMLKSYLKEKGIIEGLNDKKRLEIEERAEVIERYLELLQHGQSKPIDRQVLEDSGAVSTSFIDEVSDKLEKLGFDPVKLLQALLNGEVSGFRNNKREELEEYFINHGYIQQNDPFSPGEIQTKMMAFISLKDVSVEEAEMLLNRMEQK